MSLCWHSQTSPCTAAIQTAQEDCGMLMSMWAAAKHILSTDATQRMQVGDRCDAVFSQVFALSAQVFALSAELAWKGPRLLLGQVCARCHGPSAPMTS